MRRQPRRSLGDQRRLAGCLAAALLLGCGGDDDTTAGAELAVYPIEWNSKSADVGQITSVSDDGALLTLFGDRGATVMSAGEVVSTDDTVTSWQGAGIIPGADLSGLWSVGVDIEGNVFRAQPHFELDNVSGRYDLADLRVTGAVSGGPGISVFGYEGGLAVADGETVIRYELEPFQRLTGSDGRVAVTTADSIIAFDLATKEASEYALASAAYVAFDGDGRLVAASTTDLYLEDGAGVLQVVYTADAGPIHGLVTSGTRVWVAAGLRLGVLEGGEVTFARGAGVLPNTELVGSLSGAVWTITDGALSGYSAEAGGDDGGRAAWEENIGPILDRSCNSCHLPDGPAKIDLSTYETWVARRAAILQRVVTTRTMPPQGSELSDEDRETIRIWAEGGE